MSTRSAIAKLDVPTAVPDMKRMHVLTIEMPPEELREHGLGASYGLIECTGAGCRQCAAYSTPMTEMTAVDFSVPPKGATE